MATKLPSAERHSSSKNGKAEALATVMVRRTCVESETVCGICQTAVAAEEARCDCPECRAAYHADCWQENKGCAVYGCSKVPETELRESLEIPVSYWGQEKKPCPNCGKEIMAAAIRCRSCGAEFASARPEDRREFRQRKEVESHAPKLRQHTVLLVVFAAIPFTAPIAALYGYFWYGSKKDELNTLPRLYPTLAKIAIGLGVAQTAGIAAFGVLFSVLHR
jgi:hypothetical protein